MTKEELLKERKVLKSTIGEDLVNDGYSRYICDAITECADGHVDIYYSDLKDWAKDHFDDISDTIDEFGWDGCGRDLNKAVQMAQFRQYEQEACEELEDILENYAIQYILDNCTYQLLTIDQLYDLLLGMKFDTNDQFSDIDDYIEDYFQNYVDPSEEDDDK